MSQNIIRLCGEVLSYKVSWYAQYATHLDMTDEVKVNDICMVGILTSKIIIKVAIPDWVPVSIFSKESTRKVLLKNLEERETRRVCWRIQA